jgi:competence protein ComEC
MRKRATAFCGRHPLFAAALVTVASVLACKWHPAAGAGVALFSGLAGGFFLGWRTAAGWCLAGLTAAGCYTWRVEMRNKAERDLLVLPGGPMRGRILKDARAAGDFWSAPATLLEGPRAGARVWWEGRGETPVAGAEVRGVGNFTALREMRNPGDFDQAGWLRSQGIATVFEARHQRTEVRTGPSAAFGASLRRGFRTAVTDGLAEQSQEAVVIRAVVIGEQPPDAEELVAAFRNSGTLHAFSVSGLHVAMVGMIGWFVLGWLGVPRKWAILLLLPLIFGYSWITGNSAPAVRSAWMAAVFLGAFVFQRKPDLLNALGAVLLVAMLWDGRLLFLPGVQLSYFVVAAIAVGAGRATGWFSWMARPELYLPMGMMRWWQRAWLWVRQKVAQSCGVSIAAGVGSTPLTAFHFGLVTPVSILAGVVFVPLVFILLSAALFSAAAHPLVPSAARFVNRLNGQVAWFCVEAAEAFSAIPGGHYQIRREREPFLLVYDLEYGSGAACFSGGDSGAVLMDCGDRYSFSRRVAPSLRRLGITPDSVVLSHPDGGHLGGGAAVWEAFPIKQALLPVERSRSPAFRAWLNEAPLSGVRLSQAGNFQILPMPDGARLEVIHAPEPIGQNAIADDRVAVYRLHWRGWKLLFTSDSGLGTELDLLDRQSDLRADVIIAGRHRGDVILCDRFLDVVDPQVIVASHSEFPVSEKLKPRQTDYWRSRGIGVVHQGLSGGVTMRVDDGGNLRLEGFADKSLLVLKPR